MGKTYTEKELKEALEELVKRNYLKKTAKGYMDSDRVTFLLKSGKTRKQIAFILNKEVKPNSSHK